MSDEHQYTESDLVRARELEKSAEEVYRGRSEELAKQTERLIGELELAQSKLRQESARADQAEAAVAELVNVRENLTRVLTELSDEIAILKTQIKIFEDLAESERNAHLNSIKLFRRVSERH